MSKKSIIKKQIAESEQELEALEKKRVRSQSALLESYLNHTQANPTDEEYFRVYTQLIELERKHMRELQDELEKLE